MILFGHAQTGNFLRLVVCEKEEIAVSVEKEKHQKQKRNNLLKRLPMLGVANGLDEFLYFIYSLKIYPLLQSNSSILSLLISVSLQ